MLPKFVLLALSFTPGMLPQDALQVIHKGSSQQQPIIGTFSNGRFHHTLTATEFTFPSDWTLVYQGQSSGGGQQIGFTNSTLHVDAFVWMKLNPIASSEIPDKLRSVIDFKAGQREGTPGFTMLRNTIEHKTVGGQSAVSIESEYDQGNVKMEEYHTWVISEKTQAYLSARVPAQDFLTVKSQIDFILATFSVP